MCWMVSWMHRQPAGLLAVLAACLCLCPADSAKQPNYRPIIGVLAQENRPEDVSAQGVSYIAASYVKYLEAAGARVVPIRITHTKDKYVEIFESINGLLLPGGDVDIEKSQFTRVAKIFYDLALKANNKGDYFPIWGTCQGFQQLTVFTANQNLLSLTDTKAVALPLNFVNEPESSRLFQSFPKDLLQALAEENITSNFHSWSLTVQNFTTNVKLKTFYRILSTNSDGKKEFISSMEALRYPIYMVQWHPEKGPFEWIDKPGMVHSNSAIRAAFYTAAFFVSEATKSNHTFPSRLKEDKALIYNYCPVKKSSSSIFQQIYYFN